MRFCAIFKIALHILRIPTLHNNLEIGAQSLDCVRLLPYLKVAYKAATQSQIE